MKQPLSEEGLSNGLEILNLSINRQQKNLLISHLNHLVTWNKKINLTSVHSDEMITKHVIDSLSVYFHLKSYQCIADVGSGAGFPGIPLAILYPKKEITLIESNQKKCRFLKHVKIDLGLENLKIVSERIELLQSQHKMDAIVTRAFTQPKKLWGLCFQHLQEKGKLFAMISKDIDMDNTLKNVQFRTHRLPVPSCLGERYIMELSQA